MKFLLLLFLLSSQSLMASERFETKEKLITTNFAEIELKLNNSTVLCSFADYGASFLKILIPELADLTVMDHQNTGAGAPCVAAGMCELFEGDGGFKPSDILDEARPTENVSIEVSLTRIFFIDNEKLTCDVSLKEVVKTNVRGVDFFHSRSRSLGSRLISDCQ